MYTSIMCINIIQNIKAVAPKLQEEIARQTMYLYPDRRTKLLCPTTCHYQIFDENQNPVDMHTSIMCINILQNIKAVAPKLQEEIDEQTMYLYPDGQTDGQG